MRAFFPPDGGCYRSSCRQQGYDDGAVACRCRREREGGKEGEPDDDSAGNHGQPDPLAGTWEPLPGQGKGSRGKGRGDDCTTRSNEKWGQTFDRDSGERNGQGKGEDP